MEYSTDVTVTVTVDAESMQEALAKTQQIMEVNLSTSDNVEITAYTIYQTEE